MQQKEEQQQLSTNLQHPQEESDIQQPKNKRALTTTRGPQMTKCNTANGDAQDVVETISPVEKAVSSADKSSSSRSSSYEEVEEEDDKANRESCGLSGEVLDTTNESVEMEEEHIIDHANSNGRDHVVDDVCSKSSEIAQISPKVEENGESGGSSTTSSSSGNGTAEATAAETIDQTEVATKCRNGDSDIGAKEGIGVAPETNGFEEENTSSTSSNSKKKAPYFENHHNDNNDKSMASSSLNSAEGESEVQRVLRLQTTHDLLCPDCGTCITKRVILRKRKRTSPSVVSVEKWVLLNVEEIQSQDTPLKLHTSPPTSPPADDHHHGYHVYEEDWGCLACFTLFFRRETRYHFPPKKHHLPHQSQAHPPAPTYHPKDQSQQQPEEITEEGVVGVDPEVSRHPAETLEQATPKATKDQLNKSSSSSWFVFCQLFSRRLKRVFFPISAGSTLSSEDGLREGLLKENPDTANTDSPTTDISASIPEVYETTSVTTTVIQVHDAPPMPEAVTAATVSKVQEYLKSVVYGGLDVSLISLGVVASAAGGDAKTRTVLAMGLANLIFGSISFFHKVIELHKESPRQFTETVGQSFLLNGCLAFLSFLVFGSLPTLTFGFSFRQSNNHDYKMLATVVVSVISVMLLGCAKVFAKVTQRSYFATLSALIMTGVVAAVAGFYTGEYFSKLLAQFGFDT
ncbi:unnamed protein product [Sphagnum jensenii]|uniref:Uncharacterized protein n=1 Tax=Sphagnum jensenii TaxID=128206 RepID=A0ABP1A8U9_9BRYO